MMPSKPLRTARNRRFLGARTHPQNRKLWQSDAAPALCSFGVEDANASFPAVKNKMAKLESFGGVEIFTCSGTRTRATSSRNTMRTKRRGDGGNGGSSYGWVWSQLEIRPAPAGYDWVGEPSSPADGRTVRQQAERHPCEGG